MTTSHTTPTPPHPRPGGDNPRPDGGAQGAAGTFQRPDAGLNQDMAQHQATGLNQDAGQHQATGLNQDAGQHQATGQSGNVFGVITDAGFFGLRPWQALFAAGAVSFVLGLIVLIWPGATLLVLALLFGCYLVLTGVLSLVEGLSDHGADGAMKIAYIVLGVLGILLGLFCLRRIDVTVLLLAFLLSAFWIMRGIVDLAAATSRREVSGRGLRAFTGALSLVAGVLVLFWPGITLTTLLVFAGAWLLIYGVTLAMLGFGLRRALQRS